MNQGIYLALDGLTGAIISVMVVANTNLGHATTMGVSLLVNHLIGFTRLDPLLRAEQPRDRRSETTSPLASLPQRDARRPYSQLQLSFLHRPRFLLGDGAHRLRSIGFSLYLTSTDGWG